MTMLFATYQAIINKGHREYRQPTFLPAEEHRYSESESESEEEEEEEEEDEDNVQIQAVDLTLEGESAVSRNTIIYYFVSPGILTITC